MWSLHSTPTVVLIAITFLLSAPITSLHPAPSETTGHTLEIVNGSRRDIHRLQLSSSGTGSWGPDLLGRTILRSGEARSWGGIGPGEFDVLVIDGGGNQCVRKNVMIFNNISVRITDQCF